MTSKTGKQLAAGMSRLRGVTPKDHRFTTQDNLAEAAAFAGLLPGEFTLDAAAHPRSHHGAYWYCPLELLGRDRDSSEALGWLGHDGLVCPWFGHVWCNPPFSNLDPWLERAWREVLEGHGADGVSMAGPFHPTSTRKLHVRSVTMLLPANRTEQPFWQRWVEPWRERIIDPGPLAPHNSKRVEFRVRFPQSRKRFGSPSGPPPKGSPFFAAVYLNWRVLS